MFFSLGLNTVVKVSIMFIKKALFN